MRHHFIRAAALALACTLVSAFTPAQLLAADQGVLLRDGDRLSAQLDVGDEDAFDLDLVEGGSLRLDVTPARGSGLVPQVRLHQPDGTGFDVGPLTRHGRGGLLRLAAITIPAGGTGRWQLRLTAGAGTSGGYKVAARILPPPDVRMRNLSLAAGERIELPFFGDSAAHVTYSVRALGGALPVRLCVIDPNGDEVEGAAQAVAGRRGRTVTRKATLHEGLGRYSLRVEAPAEGDAKVDVRVGVRFPHPKPRRDVLRPEGRLVAVAPAEVRQDDVGVTLDLTASGLIAGSTARIDGGGVTVRNVDIAGDGTSHLLIDVAADAPYGPRRVVVFPPALLGESLVLENALTVRAPDPTVTAIDPVLVKQGETQAVLEVQGTGFRDGATISVGGSDLVVGPTQVLSPSLARTTVSLDLHAQVGPREITFTQPAAGGGAVAPSAPMLAVHYADPTVTGVSPAVLHQEDAGVVVTLSGTNFRVGGTVSVAGTGVQVIAAAVSSEGTLSATLDVAADATFGLRDVLYTQPADGGSAVATLAAALTVRAPDPTITSIATQFVRQLDAGVDVVVIGTGFRAGGDVTFSGTGLTTAATRFVSPTEVRVAVTVAEDAAIGTRSVTYAQPSAGGGATATDAGTFSVHYADPQITSISPSAMRQEDTSRLLTLTGSNFRPGGTVTITGPGITLTSPSWISAQSFRVTVSVAPDATFGARDVAYTQPSDGGGAKHTLAGAFAVRAPDPVVSTVAPAVVKQLETATLTVTGTGFRSGGAIGISGTGFTIGATTVVSPTQATVQVTAAQNATVGTRSVTFTQSASGGGAASTLAAALTVSYPTPSLSAMSPTVAKQEQTGVLVTLTGTNFRAGGTVSVSGTGITVSSPSWISDTSFSATLDVASDAAFGARSITYQHPADGGGAQVTLASAFSVAAPDPTVTAVSPTIVRQEAHVTLTLTGTSFRQGGTVAVSGTGVIVSAPTWISNTSFEVTLDVDPAAAFGLRDVTYQQPAAGGGAQVTRTGAVTVNAPDAVVTSASPGIVKQNATITLTVAGSGFRAGGALSVSGPGLTLGSTTVVSAAQATVQVTAADTATIGARDVTFTQPVSGGGYASTLTAALAVHYPTPTVTATSPSVLKEEETGLVVTLTGTNFRTNGTVSVSGAGVTVVSRSWISTTSFQATLDVAGDAAFGARSVTYTQPADGGSESTTLVSAFTVQAPDPTATSVSPTLAKQEAHVTLTLTGTRFRQGGTIAVSGTGITVSAPTWISDTSFQATLDIASDATFGTRNVTFAQPSAGGGATVTLTNALTINAPDPVVTAVSPAVVKQLETATLTVTGTGFRSGGAIGISGTGFTIGATTVVSPTQATVQVTAAQNATVGTRSVTFTQSASGGGAASTLAAALTVSYPTPSLSAMSPTVAKQEQTGVLVTLTGTNFRAGGTVSVSGTGITVSSPSWISDTSFSATLDVASDAAFGARSITYQHPADGGGAQVTLASAFDVRAPDPTVTAVSPGIVKQLQTLTLTVTGTGFRTGGTVSVAGTGLTLGATTIVSATQATVDVMAAVNATISVRDVTYTQPAAGAGASATLSAALAVHYPTPLLTAASPSVLRQEQTGVVVTLTGDHFRTGGTVAISGTGVTLSSPTRVSDTSFQVTMDLAFDAPYGARSLTYSQPTSGGGAAVTLNSAVTITAPVPTVTAVAPAVVKQLETATLTVTGTGFRAGGALSVSGTGVTLGATTIVSATQATVDVTAAVGATVGLRDVTYAQPASGGGATGTLASALAIQFPTPVLTTAAPGVVKQEAAAVVLTLSGDNLRAGGTVSVSGTGVTVSAPTWISNTSFQATLAVAANAPFGARNVTYQHPAGGGGAQATLLAAFTVNAPDPAVTAVAPGAVKQLTTTTVTVTGTGFRSGGTLTVSGPGLTLGATTIVSATQAAVDVTVAANAAISARNVTYTQPASGGGAGNLLAAALAVHYATPVLTALSPSTLKQEQTGVVVTLTGDNFRTGGTVSVSGSGVTASSPTWISDTSFQATLDVAFDAAFGTRTVTYTQPSNGGAEPVSLVSAITVSAPDPSVTSVSPAIVKQAQNLTLTVTGTGFRTGGTVSFSGTGITVTNPRATSGTTFLVDLAIASDATFGPRILTYTQPAAGGGATASLMPSISVRAPDPTLTAVSPATVRQEQTGLVVTLTGTGFRSGATVTLSGTGVTLSNPTCISDSQFTITLDVAFDAAFGSRNVTYTQPSGGGGATVTLNSAFVVNAPSPAITSITPSSMKQLESGTLTVNGTGFRSGGTLSIAGTGLTLGSPVIVSATQVTMTVAVAVNATLGARTVTYTQPASGGGATATTSFTINCPDPVLTTIAPTVVKQEQTGVVLTLTGDNFRTGGTVTVNGTGVTVSNPTRISDTSFTATLDIAANATFGLRDVTYTQPASGGGAAITLVQALTVRAPDPTVASAAPASVRQGTGPTTLTVTGTGFRSGGALSISGTGLTLGATTFVSATQATISVTAAIGATMGARDVTWTQPAGGGGAAATGAGILQIHAPIPTVTAVAPTSVTQGDAAVTITLTGTNFRAGGTVTLGNNITVTGPTWISDTSFQVTAAVAIDAALGTHDVIYTQPVSGGGASATLANSLQVNAPTPTVTAVSPTSMPQGATSATLTVTGTNFRTGGALSISGTGLTLSATTVVSATTATVAVTVASSATVGTRNVTYTHPVSGGGGSATGTNLLTILHPTPTLTAVSPTIIERGTSGTLTLTGTNFRSGGAVSTAAAPGVTISSPAWVSDTQFTASYSASASATLGLFSVTYTQPASGGGASATLANALDVNPPGPQFSSMTPNLLGPGAFHVVLRIVGASYVSGTSVAFSGTGVTVHSTSFVSATILDVDVSTASDATIGARDLTITPGSGGGSARTFTARLTIIPPDPIVSSATPATMAQGQTVTVTVFGQNFRSGDTLSASGSGISFSSHTVTGTMRIDATAAVSASAATGLRDVTVTHSAAEGGRSSTLLGAIRVTGATPTVTSVSPGTVGVTGTTGPAREVPLTITGTNFVSGATVAIVKSGASGVAVQSSTVTVVSDTRIDLTIALAGSANTGLWNVTVTNPSSLGSGTGTNLLDVKASNVLAVNRVIASSGGPYGGERVTIQGSGFADGYRVDFGTTPTFGTQIIDANTMVTTVPRPGSVSATTATAVNVRVTPVTGTAVTLANGYRYGPDTTRFVTTSVVPAQGTTGVARNLIATVVVLSAPANTTTGAYGGATGTNSFWFESGGGFTPSGFAGFGPGGRFLVFSRSSTGNLPITSGGVYVLDIPTAMTSLAGNAFIPTRLASTLNHDQQTFTLSPTATDTTAPTLSTITPANGATSQDTMSKVVMTFGEPLNPLTVSLTPITLTRGSGIVVAAALDLSDDLRTVTITPENELLPSTTYTVTVGAAVTDLCSNAITSLTRTFTTGSGVDTTVPTIDAVIVESLPSTLDGSGTYVNSAGTGGVAFDAFLPRDGWLLDVRFSDTGGSGIDDTTFSARCSVAVGGTAANGELASNFSVSSNGATWRIPSGSQVTAAEDVTFTFLVKDKSTNTSATRTIVVDVIDRNASAVNGGDHDAIDSRRTWILRADLDAYTATFASTNTPSAQQGATTSVAANGVSDLDESLRLVGLNTTNMTSAAAATVNGAEIGTNAILRRLFLERLRELMNERFLIAADGTHDASSVDIEFLLPGEQGSLSSLPVWSTSNSSNSSKSFSEISIGGTLGADSSAYTTSSAIGQAWFDPRNLREEANLNTSSSGTGIYLLGALKLQVNANTLFKTRVSQKFVTIHGGTPAGEDASDDDVLAGSFNRTSSGNTTFNARYDAIMDAIEQIALYTSAVTAHEVGHSLGLVPDGGPKTGLFGNAHYNNTFTEATSTSPNTSGHLDFLGNDMMSASTTFDSTTYTGADFKRFSPMDISYLRNRLLHDEGR